MSQSSATSTPENTVTPENAAGYVVVARRYRPQAFDQVVGQEQVVKALSNAIRTNRVAHAYLFTGARGVGKTSSARILAKCLNCEQGPTLSPCNECDVCRSISVGEDVDVLEIDGASNRGINEMRELRQGVGVRPSRSRYKIYIIDEVHMLTNEAFNALLKTLEEPPEHVKFIFCTTEADKIPITILSRCQRFDFASIRTDSISDRLRQIVQSEGREIEPEAVAALARRAAGSMRDSQSLLDQLLAFGGPTITAADVHSMLGTADDALMGQLVECLMQRNPSGLLASLDVALDEGVDVGQLLDQLLGYLRDVMLSSVGGSPSHFLYTSPTEHPRVQQAGQQMGLETVLAALQILAETKGRLRYSTQGRILTEVALVRCCRLEDLDALPRLVAELRTAAVPSAPTTVKAAPPAPSTHRSVPRATLAEVTVPQPVAVEPAAAVVSEQVELTSATAEEIWRQMAQLAEGPGEHALKFSKADVEGRRLVLTFPQRYTFNKNYCERHQSLMENSLSSMTGQRWSLEFRLEADAPHEIPPPVPTAADKQQEREELAEHPFVKKAVELFQAKIQNHKGPE